MESDPIAHGPTRHLLYAERDKTRRHSPSSPRSVEDGALSRSSLHTQATTRWVGEARRVGDRICENESV